MALILKVLAPPLRPQAGSVNEFHNFTPLYPWIIYANGSVVEENKLKLFKSLRTTTDDGQNKDSNKSPG